ncbi:MAG: hypothetical protein O8C64_13600 [Candidatus Methanoperedens sp.]|nr:hypothetical protein [Candidatus Methanoperedens sp.]MCZ7403761.1 hypothetical protein [Candidatus Methanoperedens sp.]
MIFGGKTYIAIVAVLALAVVSGCLQGKEEPAVTPVEKVDLIETATEVNEIPAEHEPVSCQPLLAAGTFNIERIAPVAEMLPLFGLNGENISLKGKNVTVIGNTTWEKEGGEEVNVTIIRVDNETVYAYNETSNNVTYGVIRDNFTITHPLSLNPVDLLRANVTKVLNLTGVEQKTDSSCAPTAAGAIIKYYNKTHPSIMGGRNLSALVDELARLMNTSQNGTETGGILDGLTKHLNNTGKSRNFTIELYLNITKFNTSVTINTTINHVVNNTGKAAYKQTLFFRKNYTNQTNYSLPDNNTIRIPVNVSYSINESVNVTIPANFKGTIKVPVKRTINTSAAVNSFLNTTVNNVSVAFSNRNINYSGIKKEFIDKNQAVLVNVLFDGRQHTMALDNLGTVQKPNGMYDISFMDPASGTTYVTEINADGSFDYLGKEAVVMQFISLSPK